MKIEQKQVDSLFSYLGKVAEILEWSQVIVSELLCMLGTLI